MCRLASAFLHQVKRERLLMRPADAIKWPNQPAFRPLFVDLLRKTWLQRQATACRDVQAPDRNAAQCILTQKFDVADVKRFAHRRAIPASAKGRHRHAGCVHQLLKQWALHFQLAFSGCNVANAQHSETSLLQAIEGHLLSYVCGCTQTTEPSTACDRAKKSPAAIAFATSSGHAQTSVHFIRLNQWLKSTRLSPVNCTEIVHPVHDRLHTASPQQLDETLLCCCKHQNCIQNCVRRVYATKAGLRALLRI